MKFFLEELDKNLRGGGKPSLKRDAGLIRWADWCLRCLFKEAEMTTNRWLKHVAIVVNILTGSWVAYATQDSPMNVSRTVDKVDQKQRDEVYLEDKTFSSQGGHTVQFWRNGENEWRATVRENLLEEFMLEHDDLLVKFENDEFAEALLKGNLQQKHLHVLLRSDLPENFDDEGLVYVGSFGLNGGGVCQEAVQGKIAWDYNGSKQWNPSNVGALCLNATTTEPAVCFNAVMHGGINWGGGTKWYWKNALNLCRGTYGARLTVKCFEEHIKNSFSWQKAIEACQDNKYVGSFGM